MNGQLSETQTPPGGWQWYQPQSGWSAPNPIANTLGQQVVNVIKHRQANGALTVQHKLSIDPAVVKQEILNYNRLRLGIPMLDASPKTSAPRPLPQAVRAAVAAVGRTAEGVALLIDWLGSGAETVAPALSAKRAAICADCPQNGQGEFTRWYTQPVADRLKAMIEARKDLKLETPSDDKLGVCNVCQCPMKLKAHTPLAVILEKTKPATLAEFPNWCWIARRDQ